MKKKIKILSLFLFLALPTLTSAQDGTSDVQDSSVVRPTDLPIEMATATPRALPESSSVISPSADLPRSTTSPIISTTTLPAESIQETPTLPDQSIVETLPSPVRSFGFMTLSALTGIIALGGYGAYKLSSNKNKQKDKSRCFDIKDLMDKKLEEITDLKGQIESKTKDMTREKIKEMIKEPYVAGMINTIENGEKEYERLKNLFDRCMIEFESEETFIYHRVPKDMHGTILYPLNILKNTSPHIYNEQAKKYEGREKLFVTEIPPLKCLWNDVLHFTAVTPEELKNNLKKAGIIYDQMSWFKIPTSMIRGNSSIAFTFHRENGVISNLKDYEKFDPNKIETYRAVPKETIKYYKEKKLEGIPPLLYHLVPHILYKGSIDTKNLEIITV